MKRILTIAVLFLCGITAFSQTEEYVPITGVGLEGLIIEAVTPSAEALDDDMPAGSITYRIFVDMEEGYTFSTFGGDDFFDPQKHFIVQSTEIFFNNTLSAGMTGVGNLIALWGFSPSVQYDSYGTDGRIGTDHIGVLFSRDTADGTVDGITPMTALTTPISFAVLGMPHPFLLDNATTFFDEINGGWTGGNPVGPTAENIVFAGQLTTAGELQFLVNIGVLEVGTTAPRYTTHDIAYPQVVDEAPVATWISPVDDSEIHKGVNVTLEANATDDNEVLFVEFFVDKVSKGKDFTNDGADGYSVDWTADADESSVDIYAVVVDSKAQTDTTETISLTLINDAPVISSLTPSVFELVVDNDTTFVAEVTDADGTVSSVLFELSGDSTNTYTDNSAPFEYTYTPTKVGTYTVTAIATDNYGSQSDAVDATFTVVSGETALNSVNLTNANIYPNPTNSEIHVVFDGVEDVAIINVSGQLIELHKNMNGSTTFDARALPAGNYTIMVGTIAYQVIVVK